MGQGSWMEGFILLDGGCGVSEFQDAPVNPQDDFRSGDLCLGLQRGESSSHKRHCRSSESSAWDFFGKVSPRNWHVS